LTVTALHASSRRTRTLAQWGMARMRLFSYYCNPRRDFEIKEAFEDRAFSEERRGKWKSARM
jgi:hypothetical protein